ncbi:hypothetical protein FPHOBKDP_00038 [Listeria phage LPJP1]|nr:hypothetical protein FPHOBKDP_00038 [Listeria phage LPJP1]
MNRLFDTDRKEYNVLKDLNDNPISNVQYSPGEIESDRYDTAYLGHNLKDTELYKQYIISVGRVADIDYDMVDQGIEFKVNIEK